MADSTFFVISTITRGLVLEQTPTSVTTSWFNGNNAQGQYWHIIYSDDKQWIAFQNVASKQYLRLAGPGDFAKIQIGDIMWWAPVAGDSPGAWWFRSFDYGNYLCNKGGGQQPNNVIHGWQSNLQGWNYTMMWYINDPHVSGNMPGGTGGSAESNNSKAELEAKEKALQDREDELNAREAEFGEMEASSQKRKEEIEAREKAVAEKEQNMEERQKELIDKEESLKTKSQEVESKEDALNDRTEKLEQREQAVSGKETQDTDNGSSGSGEVADLQRQLQQMQRELDEAKSASNKQAAELAESKSMQKKQADELEQLQKEVNAAGNSNAASGGGGENDRLRQKLEELEIKLAAAKKSPSSASSEGSNGAGGRQDLREIKMQQSFGYLPRLTLPLPSPQPPRAQPPRTQPPANTPPLNRPSATKPPENRPSTTIPKSPWVKVE